MRALRSLERAGVEVLVPGLIVVALADLAAWLAGAL